MPRQIDSDAEIDSIRMKEQSSAPATPSSGYGQIYCKSDGLYFKGDDGVEIGPLSSSGIPAGTSFPGAPAGGDQFFRTDRGIAYFYHTGSSQWLSMTLYEVTPTPGDGGAPPYSATPIGVGYLSPNNTYGMYLVSIEATTFVLSTLNGSNFWTYSFNRRTTNNTNTEIVNFNNSTGTASNWEMRTAAINANLDSSAKSLVFVATKTGSPGTTYFSAKLLYRLRE